MVTAEPGLKAILRLLGFVDSLRLDAIAGCKLDRLKDFLSSAIVSARSPLQVSYSAPTYLM